MPARPEAERHRHRLGIDREKHPLSSSFSTADPLGASASASASGPAQQQQHEGTEPLACVSCRARKLKCDRTKPACTRCAKANNPCEYPESRRKPAFRRRNVKELEARLAQVEDYLKEVAKNPEGSQAPPLDPAIFSFDDTDFAGLDVSPEELSQQTDDFDVQPAESSYYQSHVDAGISDFDFAKGGLENDEACFESGQLMRLGLSETLPPFEVMEELNNLFFSTQYHYIPVVHPGRYMQAFYGGPLNKPPMFLQYAIWALASYIDQKFTGYTDIFYQRARKYAEADEMKGAGEHFITIAHAQAYAILASYEAKAMLFTRAAITSAKAVRLVHMMGLDRLDGEQDLLPPTLGPATSWVELEERRRVFWGAFAIDAHASISTGWPSLISSEGITTRLPASEQAFTTGKEEEASFLDDVFSGAQYVGFAGTIVICRIFKAIMYHVHRHKPSDHPENLNHGNFWKRHRELDNDLSSAFMFLPEKLRLPQNIREPTALYTNLNLHASVICLHHAAIEMVEKHKLPEAVKLNSNCRLRTAAEEIVAIIKASAHNTGIFKSPLSALSMYCASTVYVYMAKENGNQPPSPSDRANLELVIQSMEAIGKMHKITQEFLVQASRDVERNGLSDVLDLPTLRKYTVSLSDGPCSSIPMLARGHIGKHTDVPPVLPGRLPLDKPQGKMLPSGLTLPRAYLGSQDSQANVAATCQSAQRDAVEEPYSYQPSAKSTNKRRRTSPGPSASDRLGRMSMMGMSAAPGMAMEAGSGSKQNKQGAPGAPPPRMMSKVNVILPDRTTPSSTSSPRHESSGGGGASTQTGSSHTSPEMLGLGNTFEENRVDLRPFQDRVSTPIWPSPQGAFYSQITETIVNTGIFPGSLDPWGILNEDINWDQELNTELNPELNTGLNADMNTGGGGPDL